MCQNRNTWQVQQTSTKNQPGSYYTEVMDWSTNKMRRLVLTGQQGDHYVEVVDNMPGGDFHSNDLDIEGTSHRVKLVNLAENNEQIKVLEEKIRKLSKRLEILPA